MGISPAEIAPYIRGLCCSEFIGAQTEIRWPWDSIAFRLPNMCKLRLNYAHWHSPPPRASPYHLSPSGRIVDLVLLHPLCGLFLGPPPRPTFSVQDCFYRLRSHRTPRIVCPIGDLRSPNMSSKPYILPADVVRHLWVGFDSKTLKSIVQRCKNITHLATCTRSLADLADVSPSHPNRQGHPRRTGDIQRWVICTLS
ncbi:hypothetical protein BD779DRAFT_494989 [Infundibulicybe gibba]|nr:hypothetical protein BD779DRAFT_494989 [Infundibulicybe gibba]